MFLVKIELSLEPLAEHSEQAKYVFTPVAQLALPLPPLPGVEKGNVFSTVVYSRNCSIQERRADDFIDVLGVLGRLKKTPTDEFHGPNSTA